jgi:3-carboxy-cis,cis-muconate cycloisomerase
MTNLFARAILGSDADEPFADSAVLHAMLRFEVALARAQGRLGLIPAAAAEAIAAHAPGMPRDTDALAGAAALAGSLAIPFVRVLTEHVRQADEQAAVHVHSGATSQDVLDTALVLCTRTALGRLDTNLLEAARSAAELARRHAGTPVLARTLLQPAGVTSVGLRCAQWATALMAARQRLRTTAHTALAVSLGGAIGNLGAWSDRGAALRAEVARELELHDPGLTWHTLRAPWTALANDAALAAGTMGKVARDIASAACAEVAELAEPEAPGRGSSSAMPHKRNPVLCMRVLAAVHPVPALASSLLAGMQQEQERGLGNWQAELSTAPELYSRVCAAADVLRELLGGLRVDARRCAANIDALQGTILSEALAALLIPALGRTAAHALVAALCRQALEDGVQLRDLVHGATDPRLAALARHDIDRAFDVDAAASVSRGLVEPVLGRWPELRQA